MTNIARIDARTACPDLSTLEDVLAELARFGKSMLWRASNGWACRIEMFIQGDGITFEVKAEMNHTAPMAAASQCLDHMHAALRDVANHA